MTALEEKIQKIAEAQLKTANQLSELLTRDPRKEFIYGQQYDPHSKKRFESNVWQTLVLPGAAAGIVFIAPNICEEITVTHALAASALTSPMLRVDMDDNALFKNVPVGNATRSRFIPANYSVVNGANWNYGFSMRFPCVFEFIRITLVGGSNAAQAWAAGAILNVGFHGQ